MQMLNSTNNCYLRGENNIFMTKNAISWIREDFRIENNPALSYATQNHESVLALYIYNRGEFDAKREAQKWWLCKSLEVFKLELSKYKINLQILEGDELEVFSKIKKKDDVSIYWNKIYEPDVIAKGKKIRDIFIKNEVRYKVKPIGTKTTIPAIKAFLNFEVIGDFFFINYKMSILQNIRQL